jgi:hypothetical protein
MLSSRCSNARPRFPSLEEAPLSRVPEMECAMELISASESQGSSLAVLKDSALEDDRPDALEGMKRVGGLRDEAGGVVSGVGGLRALTGVPTAECFPLIPLVRISMVDLELSTSSSELDGGVGGSAESGLAISRTEKAV